MSGGGGGGYGGQDGGIARMVEVDVLAEVALEVEEAGGFDRGGRGGPRGRGGMG